MSTHEAETIGALFAARVAATPDLTAYIEFGPTPGDWQKYTWEEMARRAGQMQKVLRGLGLKAGDRIGIMARGSAFWVTLDVAAAGLGIVTVPIYYRDNAGNVADVARRTAMRVLFIGGPEQWQGLRAGGVPEPVEHVYSDRAVDDTAVETLTLESGRTNFVVEESDGEALATIVFTSATTGKPKGVELTHTNVISNARAVSGVVSVDIRDRLLSFLPLSHMFERTVGYYTPMMEGALVVFARSVRTLRRDMYVVEPTLLVAVPRVYEKIYEFLLDLSLLRGITGRWLLRQILRAGDDDPWGGGRKIPALVLGGPVRRIFGGELRAGITGGAAIDPDIVRFFRAMGVPILQGYGLTELSPVVAANRLDDMHADSVGCSLDGVVVYLGEQHELLVHSPGRMRGYLDDPEATAAAIDEDGWFHTGDQATISNDGHIRIVGRLKEVIVLSTGEKAAPAELEAALCRHAKIQQAWVCGEGKKFLSAVVVAPEADEEELLAAVPELLASFPAYARLGRIHVEHQPWTAESELITLTNKLRRESLAAHYAAEIAAFYDAP